MSTQREANESPETAGSSSATSRTAALRLALQLCLPGKVSASLPGVGDVVFRPRVLDWVGGVAAWVGGKPAGEAVAIACAGHEGLLVFESRLAVGLVNGILGFGMPSFAGPLSRIERGVLEGVLATLLAQCGFVPGIKLRASTAETTPDEMLVVAISVELREEVGQAWLIASEAFLESAWANRASGASESAPWLEFAATTVAESDIASAQSGDRVVFDEIVATGQIAAWPVRVFQGERVFQARWLADGRVVAEEGLSGAATQEAATRDDRRVRVRSARPTAPQGSTVEVRAGVYCPALDPRVRPRLVVPRREPVLLRLGDHPWARGEFSEFEGSLAVTITRKLAG